ncbi:patronin-like isoform X33 [Daphnia pulex]|uniref:patronin-like isoform X33 n=1 Tax=Daphnia pulex TaxID=6669 RepID=UPI001EDDB974|nr:patronin-like isoform X33 [Daphnia pulex]
MESRSSSSARMRTLTYMPVVEVQGYNAHNKLQAKQRASVQWLLSKSYSHQVPEDVKEPFYRDVEDQEYLKPSVVHALANAELYCLALAHIYADPNYSQLNHWGVIQALARKGVYVAEPSDVALTETTLIHTSPLRMSAHMAVMEGIMNLFVKEVVSAERVVAAIRRFADLDASQTPAPKEAEQALLLWITKACQSLKKRLTAEVDGHGEDVPNFPELRELGDLSDGMSLLGLLAFYAPDLVDWTRIATNEPFSMADCLYNLELVHKFCSESLPNNIFHLGLEDIVYMHSSVRQNVLAFLADLFYILEVRPAKCIRPPGLMRDRFPINEETSSPSTPDADVGGQLSSPLRKSFHRRTSLQPLVKSIPDLRKGKSNAIRRQGSLQERDRTKRQTVHEDSNLSTRNNLYPDWWWPCQHGPTDQCHYCRPSYATLWSHHAHRQQQKHRHHQHQCHQHTADSDVMEQGKSANSPQIGTPQMSGSPRRRMDQLEQSQQQLQQQQQQPDGGDESFVVHRGKTVPTLYNVVTGGEGATPRGSRVAAIKERFNMDTKAEERGEDRSSSSSGPAGVPSNWEDRKSGTSYAGRRSRRNSITDDSHLTIENFGGSQDNLSMFGRNPDKEPATVQQSGRRPSIDAFTPDSIPPTAGTPSTPAGVNYWRRNNDRTRSQENLSDYLMDNRDVEEQLDRRSRASSPTYSSISSTAKSGSHNGNKQFVIIASNPSEPADLYEDPRVNLARATNFAELSKLRESLGSNSAINIVYMQQDKDPIQSAKGSAVGSPVSQHGRRISENQRKLGGGITIAEAMSSTSWEPQTPVVDKMDGRLEALMPDDMNSTTDLYSIRLKMEEKRKRIESDKRQQELLANRQREKVGKAAFLQVRAMMGHHGYMMNPNTGNYMDAHGPPQGGYMMQTPPRHPMDNPYDAQQHYYANGSQFNQPDPQDPYYYSPARTQQPHPMQQQQPQQQQPPPQPHYQQQQQGYGGPPAAGSPHGYPAPSPQHNYPSAADQRAPFRLHAPNDLAAEPVVLRSPANPKQQAEIPELHRGSVHNQQQPPKVQQPEQRPQSATITRPVPATRTITPIRSSVPSNGGGQSSSSTSAAGSPIGSGGVFHAAMPTPSIDDMEPQNVSFIETPSATGADGVDEADLQLPRRLRNLNITSGNRTYRIPHEATQSSPPRPALLKTFRASPSPSSSSPVSPSPSSVYLAPQPNSSGSESPDEAVLDEGVKTAKLKENVEADRGFIITFDDVATGPKRPKPQLGAKRQPSPKKLSTYSAPSETTPVSSSPAYNHNNKSGSSREGSPRRSLSSMARENRDDYSPFTPDSRDSGFGQNSQEELKLFNMATAIPGTLPGSDRTLRDYDSQDDENPTGLVIGDELVNPDPDAMDEMERKKEKILMQSLRRKQQQEEARQRKEQDALQRKEEERSKEEEKQRKKEDEKARRAIIFEQYKIKKAMEEAEKEGRPYEMPDQMGSKSGPKMRSKNNNSTPSRPRPKTIHVESGPPESYTPHSRAVSTMSAMSSKGKRGSGNNLTENRNDSRGDGVRGSNPTLSRRGSNSSLHGDSQTPNRYRTMERGHSGRKDLSVPRYGQSGGSTRNSREDLYGSRNYRGSNSSLNDADSYEAYHTPLVHSGRKGSGFMTDGDAGVGGRANPPSRRISPAVTPTSTPFRRFPSPSGPGSLPPGLVSKRRGFDDGASDVSSNQDYIGPRLYKQPAARSNRSIILNAVEYCVFPGVVNREAKQRVLEEITRSESKNFLVLFRDGGLTFRALYSFNPEKEEIIKMYGTGPKLVNDTMFEKFFKYNSGGKCFSQVHTKHLTVTIDAFTIHAGLWQGKKQSLPNKKDMTLVI